MTDSNAPRVSDHAVEQIVGRLLQIGVLIAALVVLIGGVLLLVQHGGRTDLLLGLSRRARASDVNRLASARRLDHAEPSDRAARTPAADRDARRARRVHLVAFVLQRDRTYVAITTIVLALLLYGLVFGQA